jgi:hypothetical protein
MPYVTQQQIEILDDLAARLGIDDKDEWARQYNGKTLGHDGIEGIADLTDKEAALLILWWRKDLAQAQKG